MLIKKQRVPILQMLTVGLLPSFLKVWYYRLRGARIGRGVHIGVLTVIVARTIEIGEGCEIGFATIIRGREVILRRHVKIGSMTFLDVERTFIDDDTKINERVFAGGPMLPESELRVGKNCIIMQYTFLNATKPIVIGDGSGIGGHCLLFTHGSWQSQLDGYPVTFAPITIGKNVWLPWRIFVLPGVTVGDSVTIGANSLVTRNIPAGSLATGMPAQVLRRSPDYPRHPDHGERRVRLQGILQEFFSYLEYHGWEVKHCDVDGGEHAVVSRDGKTHSLTTFLDTPAAIKEMEPGSTILTLPDVPQVNNTGVMWLNVAQATRTGSNPLGEELALFLSRYGIRFYRAD